MHNNHNNGVNKHNAQQGTYSKTNKISKWLPNDGKFMNIIFYGVSLLCQKAL